MSRPFNLNPFHHANGSLKSLTVWVIYAISLGLPLALEELCWAESESFLLLLLDRSDCWVTSLLDFWLGWFPLFLARRPEPLMVSLRRWPWLWEVSGTCAMLSSLGLIVFSRRFRTRLLTILFCEPVVTALTFLRLNRRLRHVRWMFQNRSTFFLLRSLKQRV